MFWAVIPSYSACGSYIPEFYGTWAGAISLKMAKTNVSNRKDLEENGSSSSLCCRIVGQCGAWISGLLWLKGVQGVLLCAGYLIVYYLISMSEARFIMCGVHSCEGRQTRRRLSSRIHLFSLNLLELALSQLRDLQSLFLLIRYGTSHFMIGSDI